MNRGSYEPQQAFMSDNIPIIYHKHSIIGGWSHYIHWHENIEILFVSHGVLKASLDDAIYHAKESETVVVNSSVMHDFAPSEQQTTEYDCLIIDKSFCEQYGFFVDEMHIEEVVREYELIEINNRIKYLWTERPPYYEPEVVACVLKLLTILFRGHVSDKKNYNKNKSIEMVKNGIKWIGKHFKEPIGVDEVSENVGYSKYYFSRCFKEVTGCTVNEHINRIRINYAYKKLREGSIGIGELATECGFSDVSYFTKIFKKYTGILPSKVEETEKRKKNG